MPYPFFTADEARIAYRGYVLSTQGKDELGRKYPLIFNSKDDYQLPVTSYITAIGVSIFGKNDFGVRVPFIIMGSLIVVLGFLIAKNFEKNFWFWIATSLILCLSPTLIFLSKTPNDGVVFILLLTSLFYSLTSNIKKYVLYFLVFLVTILMLLTTKFAWFVLTPFTFFTLMFFSNQIIKKERMVIVIFVIIACCLSIFLFTRIPQSTRSLKENNFSLINEITVENGINKMRGQGIRSGWTSLSEKLIFNKSFYFTFGLSNWISYFNPSIYFGNISSILINSGMFSHALIIPMLMGIAYLIRVRSKRFWIFGVLPILTFPTILTYPKFNLEIVVVLLPFLSLVIAYGFLVMKKFYIGVIIFFITIEFLISFLYQTPNIKWFNNTRPGWIAATVQEAFSKSGSNKVLISDDLVEDVMPFYEWYNPVDPKHGFSFDVGYPYKFHQSDFSNAHFISSDQAKICEIDGILFLTKRDFSKVDVDNPVVVKKYKDSLNDDRVFVLNKRCKI